MNVFESQFANILLMAASLLTSWSSRPHHQLTYLSCLNLLLSFSCTHTHIHTHTQVLLVWDDGEVRKLLRIADWVLDRLGLVQGAKSMRGLVICFGVGECHMELCKFCMV